MNTHILSDVEMLCHRVAIIVKGAVRYEGDPNAMLSDDERDAEVVLTGVTCAALVSASSCCCPTSASVSCSARRSPPAPR